MNAHIEKLSGTRYRVHVGNRFATVVYNLHTRGFTVDFGDGSASALSYPTLSAASFDAAAVLQSLPITSEVTP